MKKSFIQQYTVEEVSKLCQESNSFRELALKLGYTSYGYSFYTLQEYLDIHNISYEHFRKNGYSSKKLTDEEVFCLNSAVAQSVLRRKYKKGNFTEYKCAICGQEPFWNGKSMTLILDHENGNNTDNRLENLRWICGNCDRQLPTYSGRNKKDIHKNVCIVCGKPISSRSVRCNQCNQELQRQIRSKRTYGEKNEDMLKNREELKNYIRTKSMVEVGQIYGISDNAVRKRCKHYNLPYLKKEIDKISDEDWEKI